MRVPYNNKTANIVFSNYYKQQIGNGMTVFKGKPVMTGYGIGSFFSGLAKRSMPLLKSIGKNLASTGVNVLSNVLDGEDFSTSVKRNLKRSGRQALSDTRKVVNMNDDQIDDEERYQKLQSKLSPSPPPKKRRRKVTKNKRQPSRNIF